MRIIRVIIIERLESNLVTTARKLEQKLFRHGFYETHQTGSHRQYQDKFGHHVTIPFHRGDLPKGTENSILKQAGLK
ncbi:type II toxin-antitoxin system HicA family toxin [Lentilactobacillus otakiensis]|uniref:type II toxin-antitoxin system HicA family toxin n=1 Tax=Lentilactobacillus otakiensis TaxID=481720 RepID=UPI003D1715F5